LEIYHLPAHVLAKKIQEKEISSLEVTETFIERIEKYDHKINAVVVKTFEEAIEAAKSADKDISQNKIKGPLHGVPMTIKESYNIKGESTNWGIPDFKNNIAKKDSLAVQRFKKAGAHFIGKTNVPLNLADFQSYNDIYGVTGNPWDLKRTPGGSSGGSAAALAAGFSSLEAGSDIGGSIRNPAHYCGVFGHKPSHGIVPSSGHELIPNVPEPDLSVCGPLAKSAKDLEIALNIMAGPTDREAKGWRLNLQECEKTSLKDFKITIWNDDELAPVSTEISRRCTEIGEKLSSVGATVSFTARPQHDILKAEINYQLLLQSVMQSGMSDEEFAHIEQLAANLEPNDDSVEAILAKGTVLSHRHWIRQNYRREQIKISWYEFFEDWDLLICPQLATTAIEHNHKKISERTITVDNHEQRYFQQIFWPGLAVNAHLPSTVFPTGLSSNNLPIGLQAIGGAYMDKTTIKFAELYEKEFNSFVLPDLEKTL
tara:strand:+ start:3410 stop:4864 length:1455 start_codon:yes stop_codon:yes gene_type:complete